MYKFRNVEVGNRVWDILYGWGTVTKVKKHSSFTVKFDRYMWDEFIRDGLVIKNYCMNGSIYGEYVVRLYWNEIKFPSAEEDKCFNLKEYIKNNIRFKDFDAKEDNYTLILDDGMWSIETATTKSLGTIYFDVEDLESFNYILKQQKVTYEQLEKTIKEIN